LDATASCRTLLAFPVLVKSCPQIWPFIHFASMLRCLLAFSDIGMIPSHIVQDAMVMSRYIYAWHVHHLFCFLSSVSKIYVSESKQVILVEYRAVAENIGVPGFLARRSVRCPLGGGISLDLPVQLVCAITMSTLSSWLGPRCPCLPRLPVPVFCCVALCSKDLSRTTMPTSTYALT
jgi:hypothetical protein